jgi:hypothetical protein
MKRSSYLTGGAALALMFSVVALGGCSDSYPDHPTEEPKVEPSGFKAKVSGAVNGDVTGAGIITYLPPKAGDLLTGRSRPGYYLLANNLLPNTLEGKDLIITFRIPDGVEAGNHNLMPPDPLNVGEDFDAQVEVIEKGKTISYHSNPGGVIILDHFSPDPAFPELGNGDGDIKGTFQFVAENLEGEQILVSGEFDFTPGREVMTKNLEEISHEKVSNSV